MKHMEFQELLRAKMKNGNCGESLSLNRDLIFGGREQKMEGTAESKVLRQKHRVTLTAWSVWWNKEPQDAMDEALF